MEVEVGLNQKYSTQTDILINSKKTLCFICVKTFTLP